MRSGSVAEVAAQTAQGWPKSWAPSVCCTDAPLLNGMDDGLAAVFSLLQGSSLCMPIAHWLLGHLGHQPPVLPLPPLCHLLLPHLHKPMSPLRHAKTPAGFCRHTCSLVSRICIMRGTCLAVLAAGVLRRLWLQGVDLVNQQVHHPGPLGRRHDAPQLPPGFSRLHAVGGDQRLHAAAHYAPASSNITAFMCSPGFSNPNQQSKPTPLGKSTLEHC